MFSNVPANVRDLDLHGNGGDVLDERRQATPLEELRPSCLPDGSWRPTIQFPKCTTKSALLRLPLALARRRAPCQRRAVGCRGRRGRAGRGGRGEGAAGGRVGAVEKDLDMEEINWMMGPGRYILIGPNVHPYCFNPIWMYLSPKGTSILKVIG